MKEMKEIDEIRKGEITSQMKILRPPKNRGILLGFLIPIFIIIFQDLLFKSSFVFSIDYYIGWKKFVIGMLILPPIIGYLWDRKYLHPKHNEYLRKERDVFEKEKATKIKKIQDEIEKYYSFHKIPKNKKINTVIVKQSDVNELKEKCRYIMWKECDKLHFVFEKYINYDVPKVEIPIDQITTFQIQGDMYTETNISGGEIKGGGSSIGGAVAGAVLAGGVGAVVGSRKKIEGTPITSETNIVDNRETILEFYNNEDKLSYIFLDNNAYKILLKLIPEKEINFNKHRIESNNTNSSNNVYDEIKKLAELKDQGIITEEEFNEKKQELLKRI
ncbi:SHOCT domain-containing protein [Clostridium cylindrosporum]|uniref:SHOCT domain-containing protein n=1 Tax=Clostridium cylindrosporum DSM 605 TaxID=1121307 RepID=A0A0J8DB43_CLOCY|nr:SHOCT domain-containing protein [Clostridium cylindrosporum]KMT21514.1 hypothetical protein CLCY_2c02750 [Clostridium cylindrosporum DSM 605]